MSEFHGDPEALSDARGEYLELVFLDALETADTLTVSADGDTLATTGRTSESLEFLLLCRDSAAMAEAGVACGEQWQSLSLPNTREVEVVVACAGSRWRATLPIPRTGRSWENTLEEGEGFARFSEATQESPTGDRGTPGGPSALSQLPLTKDLELAGLAIDSSAEGPALVGRIRDRGTRAAQTASLVVGLDEDWDGTAERQLDSLDLALDAGSRNGGTPFTWAIPAGTGGSFHVRLGADQNPGNDSRAAFWAPGASLELSEVCPHPREGTPEWLELVNRGEVEISLVNVTYNGRAPELPTAAHGRLAPGEYAVLTSNAQDFAAAYPLLNLRVLEAPSWDVLRNTGDTVALYAFGNTLLDRMEYTAGDLTEEGSCLVPNKTGESTGWFEVMPSGDSLYGTPGFEQRQAQSFSWSVTPEIVNLENPGERFEISVSAPPGSRFTVRVFDREGLEVALLCQDCTGVTHLNWDGRRGGRALEMGPYILLIQPKGGRARKKTLILARPL